MTHKNTVRNLNNTWIADLSISIIIILSIILITSSNVHALGLAPSKEVITYDNEEHTINLRIINNDHKDMNVKIYAQGNLSEYVSVSEDNVHVASSESEKIVTFDSLSK